MSKSVPALINPVMLVWAREQNRLSVGAAADAIGVSAEKLAACEAGTAHLTFPQFLNAASAYRRAPSLFYLEEPPRGFQPIQDFRRFNNAAAGGFSPELTTVLREALERRDLALELHRDLDAPVQPFALTGTLEDGVEPFAARIRTFLGVTREAQVTWRGKAFDNWRQAIENADVLVFMVPRLPLAEMRGVAYAFPELPVILVNAKDRTNGRTFTLLHELCHLVLRASGVSGFGAEEGRDQLARIEQFCNAAAAAVLVPSDWLRGEATVVAKGQDKTWTNDELQTLALRFGVSREVVLRRLLTLGRTTKAFYDQCRPVFQKEYDDLAEQKATGGPAQHHVVLGRLGRGYTRLVLQGYHERQLTLRDVANYFNMQVKNVPAIEQAAFGLEG